MSDELRRSERSVPRLDYALLGSTGERIVIAPTTADPPHDAPATEPPELRVNETTFRDTIQLPSDTEDLSETSSDESSNESTLTPATSDSLDVTLTAESTESNLVPQISLQANLATNSATSSQLDLSQPPLLTSNTADISVPESILSQTTGHEPAVLPSSVDTQLLDALDEINDTVRMATEVAADLFNQINLLAEDMNDYIDENSMHDSYITVEDIDERTKRVEGMRTRYRELHGYLKGAVGETEYEEKHMSNYQSNLNQIKKYIKDGKTKIASIRGNRDKVDFQDRQAQAMKANEEAVQKEAISKFLLSEINRMIKELNEVFEADNTTATNDEIQSREDNLSENLLEADRLSDKFQKLLETIPETYPRKAIVVLEVTTGYNTVMKNKDGYKTSLLAESKTRELEKQKSFSASSINIKLEKFKGFASDLDIYSFKAEFEKLYLKVTPTNKLADLLKHNHLANPALGLVKTLDDIGEIWKRLQQAYGDPKTILSKILTEVKNMKPICKMKGGEEVKDGLVNLINGTRDLIKVAEEHDIEAKLYNGEGLDIIYDSMGEQRVTRWITSICEEDLTDKDLWQRLLRYLERDLKVQQELALRCQRSDKNVVSNQKTSRSGHFAGGAGSGVVVLCKLCNEDDHAATNGPNGILVVQYFACKKWVESTAAQRFRTLRTKDFCHQCLFPGAKREGKHATGGCQSTFVCPHSSHNRHPCKKHILVCHEHREDAANLQLLEDYKRKFILTQRSVEDFSKNIQLSFISCFSITPQPLMIASQPDDDGFVSDNSIYELQVIEILGELFTLFFDNGCSDMCVTEDATRRLQDRAVQVSSNEISMEGVGNVKTSAVGEFVIRLPLANGKNAVMVGACLQKLTCEFPNCLLSGDVESDIHREYKHRGGNVTDLPSLRPSVGGSADIMIGSKYLRYFPREVFKTESGLTIYESPFISSDGSRGVVCGPHESFNTVPKPVGWCKTSFYSQEYLQYKMMRQANPMFLPPKEENEFDIIVDNTNIVNPVSYPSKKLQQFERCENAGSEITFRCIDCRGCPRCRKDSRIEYTSIEEEVQQDLIEKSVTLDEESQTCTALLPLISDPTLKLAPNKKCALKVYNRVLKSLEGKDENRKAIIASEQKLQSRGKVEWVHNLAPETQDFLKNHPVQNYLPWRPVYKEDSITTPCRLVFDASAPTPSGHSLNDILAKGRNSLNKLQVVVLRWFGYAAAMHTDVEMMYNSVFLDQEHWCFQRYIFQPDLDPNAIPLEKVLRTIIYGVKPSGNQAEAALRATARLSEKENPRVCEVVHDEFYMDDCFSGESTMEALHELATDLEAVLLKTGFKIKGYTFSGQPPPESLSKGKDYITVAGMQWYSEEDVIRFNLQGLNFVKKQRGKRIITDSSSVVPEKLTKRILCGKVGEIFDLTGKIAPIIAHMKLDLRKITSLQLGWDDAIPDSFRPIWISHFEMMKELPNIKYKRAVVPKGAVSLELNTICCGDASKDLACTAIYVRFELSDGTFSCQLMFARTKLLSEGSTQPRRELTAAVMCAHTGEVVKKALVKHHTSTVKLTDSQIVLHWICNSEIPLKQYCRDRVIEILRWTNREEWHYIRSADMVADLGTRPGSTIEDVCQTSNWICGLPWMKFPVSKFPMKSCEEVKLDAAQAKEFNLELVIKKEVEIPKIQTPTASYATCARKVPEEVGKRYKFANYLLDPNKYDFSKCVRVIALVIRFVRNFCDSWKKKPVERRPPLNLTKEEFEKARRDYVPVLTDTELCNARNYYFRLATLEIQQFVKHELYSKLSKEHEGILYYTGRVLPLQKVTSVCGMTAVMKDLSESTFFVPLVDRNSPLAYSIINEVHWNNPTVKHSGVETTLRYTLLYCYILEGRELVRTMAKACERCRFLRKKTIEVAMGPVSEHQLRIAPAFYVTQVDIAGPFKAYSLVHKKSSIKVYISVFCCAATGTVSLKVMGDYTTGAFVETFVRLSCEVGFPKLLLTDEGSQLLKGCQTMKFNFRDIRSRLFLDSQVQFEACPVSGHFMHGRVERKIQQVKLSLEKNLSNEKLSGLQWETMCAQISNTINNLPIGLRSKVADLEEADLLTPNRLRLGRNNDRSPVGPMRVTSNVGRFMEENEKIFNAWYETWLISYVPTLMNHPKWFKDDADINVGDVILFLKEEGHVKGAYQYGMVHELKKSKDGKIRRVIVKYRNHSENFDRFTNRAVRELIVIHPVDELSIMTELADMQTFVNMQVPIDDC